MGVGREEGKSFDEGASGWGWGQVVTSTLEGPRFDDESDVMRFLSHLRCAIGSSSRQLHLAAC